MEPDPAPYVDELLSSWLARLAGANKISPKSLIGVLRQRLGVLGDLDAEKNAALARHLADQTGLPETQIAALVHLKGKHGAPFSAFLTSWRYCPVCWARDEHPYYRWEWRTGLAVVCTEHATPLRRQCPGCGAEVAPLLGGHQPLYFCRKCGRDLRQARGGGKIDQAALRGQRILFDLAALVDDVGRRDWLIRMFDVAVTRGGRNPSSVHKTLAAVVEQGDEVLHSVFYGGSLTRAVCYAATAAYHNRWPAGAPLPMRCHPPGWKVGPAYSEDLDNRPRLVPHLKTTLYELLRAYGAVLSRNMALKAAEEERFMAQLKVEPASIEDWIGRQLSGWPGREEAAQDMLRAFVARVREEKPGAYLFRVTCWEPGVGYGLVAGETLLNLLLPDDWTDKTWIKVVQRVGAAAQERLVTRCAAHGAAIPPYLTAVVAPPDTGLFRQAGWEIAGMPAPDQPDNLWVCNRPIGQGRNDNLYFLRLPIDTQKAAGDQRTA